MQIFRRLLHLKAHLNAYSISLYRKVELKAASSYRTLWMDWKHFCYRMYLTKTTSAKR